MLRQRTIVAAILTPLALALIYFGGYIYLIAIILLLLIAAWEYIKLLEKVKLNPADPLVLIGVLLLVGSRGLFQFNYSSAILTLLLFGTAVYHIYQYERNSGNPAADFGASISIILYIGFLGAYLISLRTLPNGRWWTFLSLPIVWIADTGAYFLGTTVGKHKISPKTSPNKTWEGYLGGIILGVVGSPSLLWLYNNIFGAGLKISYLEAASLGLVISAAILFGDLTESMIKRQASSKDSGTLFPGHGGVFDRLDSLFWAAPIGYYLILHIFLP
jgi:phosphatidate cytidylyltransferase